MRQSIESIILSMTDDEMTDRIRTNHAALAVHRGAKIDKNPAFDPLVKGRKIGDYLDAATRMYALINQSGAMLSCLAICCTLLCFASGFFGRIVLSTHEHDRIGLNG